MKQKNVNHLLLWFVKLTGVPLALLFFKPKIYYVDKKVQSLRLPKSCILMSNHKSLMDFVLYLCLFFGKTIRFLMAEVLFNKGKLFASFLFGIGGIYVNRDNYDFGFMYETIKVLDKGGIVGIFPQGRLPVGDKEWPFKPSVTYIALNSDAPIVPVYTDGNYGLFKRAKVVIGTPIDIHEYCTQKNPNEAEIKRLTEMLQSKVEELKEFLETNA
ncbi:MAG: lysophospholipid acyltransferase family protein [Acutalibacteraceae bacterium]|nr:lysophospholipid acyltransferase family protein [Acutalibacteraceae bacterium]